MGAWEMEWPMIGRPSRSKKEVDHPGSDADHLGSIAGEDPAEQHAAHHGETKRAAANLDTTIAIRSPLQETELSPECLELLRQFPVTKLKIDRSFIHNVVSSAGHHREPAVLRPPRLIASSPEDPFANRSNQTATLGPSNEFVGHDEPLLRVSPADKRDRIQACS
jgi:hypothetical protein